ncbi:WAT1-related protein At5g07050 [Hevea brasiliensis]|uniref:WAT1-related protein At5g07050 n=1 Tax=Hevea brasiliensis TaxID=3981 RepID=UPI0025D50CAB|nr:WAT1-related protein At5g07050 [Hevea brasiliensis]
MEETKECVGGGRSRNWKEKMLLEKMKPYLLSIFVAFCQAGFNIISKVYLDKGMNVYVLVAYGFAIGAVTTAVLASLFERILFYIGLEHTSSAFAAAMNNLTPLMTFILAILCRMEKLDISKLSGLAKLGGTIVGLGGATLMTLYKGITVLSVHNPYTHQQKSASKIFQDKKLVIGSLVLLIQTITAAALIILQTTTVRNYPAPMTLTSLISLVGTLLSTTLAAIIDHKASSWRLSWDNTLVAPIYNGIVIFGITIFVQTRVIQMRGPVFTSAFRPLTTVIVAIMALLILGEELHLGGVIGATMIILGLYAILWGKEDEKKKRLMEPVICDKEIEIKAEKQ